jgi:aspartate aminotransferase-like enzyme
VTAHPTDPRLADGRWLRIPGPTPVPPPVLEAMTLPMIPHRGSEMTDLVIGLRGKLQEVHRTTGEVMAWSGSGSAGWEAAIENSCRPGDHVVVTVCGSFGDRFATVAERFGLRVTRIEAPWGEPVTAEQVAATLAGRRDVRAVLVTHSETSTGVANPLREIAEVARAAGALVIVDAVSSAAAMPLETDEWELDWVISGAQKAWMCPPGLMIAAVSDRAMQAAARDGGYPRFFWDVEKMATGFQTGQLPTTPAIPLLRGLDVALDMMLAEGVVPMWERQAALARYLRSALVDLGLHLYARPGYESASITAVRPPEGMNATELRRRIREDSGIEVAIGQKPHAEDVIRIGTMGWTGRPELEATVESIARAVART